MAKRPTIIDVAKAAGVSKSTVSLVIRGSDTIKPSTHEAVREAMQELGYVYNRSAAMLRSASSGLIGLVINDLRNPFFTEFAASLQMHLTERGYATVIANTDEDPHLQNRIIQSLGQHGIAGLILSPAYGAEEETAKILAAADVPTIEVFRHASGLSHSHSPIPFIAPDYETGSRMATEHLLAQGCTRIAFLGGIEGRAVTKERMRSYLAVLQERGIDPLVLTGETSRRFGREMAREIATTHPDVDGILCFNDLVALGVLSACAEHGPRIGKALKVVGIDDIEACQDSFPSLSSVNCNIPDLARITADGVVNWLENGQAPPPVSRTKVTLITRFSTQPH